LRKGKRQQICPQFKKLFDFFNIKMRCLLQSCLALSNGSSLFIDKLSSLLQIRFVYRIDRGISTRRSSSTFITKHSSFLLNLTLNKFN
jgi:hypothetical protein